MKRTKVESSFIKSVGYDEASKTLEVAFKGRPMPISQYSDVSKIKATNFMKAGSKGSYFNSKIKSDYKVTKIV